MLWVHRSERADRLAVALGDVLAAPLDDAMAEEVVAVPTRGVERWLTQQLSTRLGTSPGGHDGVCANIGFPFPGTLVGEATAVAAGVDAGEDPWPPERMVWPLLELVDAHLHEPFLAPLAAHLGAASPGGAGTGGTRRFATLRHLADLYDHYAVHRPALIREWAAGRCPQGPKSWQARLWQLLRLRLGVPSPAERLQSATDRIAEEPGLLRLPPRLSIFGLTRLPASYLDVLEAVAFHRDVHLFLLHPSGALWDKLAAGAPGGRPVLKRPEDRSGEVVANRLLRSWGRDAREMQVVLQAHGIAGGEHRAVDETGATLLARLQADVRADRPTPPPPGPGRPDTRSVLDPADSSLRIHACHGRARQVEVLRDAILHLLAGDPSLEPRDIIVMCPDIEAFAPLIQAAFAAGEMVTSPHAAPGPATAGRSGIPQLRVRLADRSLRQTNPLLGVADHLLQLAGGRAGASEVLDFASREPVRRRFHFDDDDLSQIERWVVDMGVRWGIDADHRSRWGLGELGANTWSAGLDRLLLGVAMAEEDQRTFAGTLPVDDVASGSVDLAGRLAEFASRLARAVRSLAEPQTVEAWRDALAHSTSALALPAAAQSWQQEQLHMVLEDAAGEARAAGAPGAVLSQPEARSLLAHRLRGRPTRANFRTGDLTVCTLVPMRSVPHRVVCLLGLDDGVFPRHPERDGDDLLLDDPHVGDRDARSEDRQLLLDALLAATEHVVITFNGRDERTNHELPPAVPVAELLDVVDLTFRLEAGGRAREAVLIHHPLQPFDPRNFVEDRLDAVGAWSFDRLQLAGARSLSGQRSRPRSFLEGLLDPAPGEVVQLESLVRFVEHPVRSFLRERLGVYAGRASGEVDDALPLGLDALGKWGLGDRLLSARLGGADAARAVAAERARGLLPPGAMADAVLEEVGGTVDSLVGAVEALPCAKAPASSVEVNLPLPDGRLLIGTVSGVREHTILRCIYSTLGPRHRLATWVRFLALSAARPEVPVSAATVGKGRRYAGAQRIALAELDTLPGSPRQRRDTAMGYLARVVDLYDRGMREPLPLYCATSAAWAEATRSGSEVFEAAERAWVGSYSKSGEAAEPEHVLVLGGASAFSDRIRVAPSGDETGPGWAASESTRLGRLALRLWEPLLDHERRAEQ